MTIDVVIPAYNAEKTLERAVLSALQGAQVRVILVDDGSTDATPALCDALAADARVTVLHQRNQGVSAARNAGMARASAEFVAFLDADDVLLPGALAALGRADADAVQGLVVRDAAQPNSDAPIQRMSQRDALSWALSDPTAHLHTHGWLFRRTLLTEPFAQALTLGEDGEWLLRTLLHARDVAQLCTPVYCYTLRPGSALRGGEAAVCRSYMKTLRAAELALSAANLPEAAALYRLTHLLLMLTHGDFREAMRMREEPMFREAFRQARLTGSTPRIWTLRLLKWRLTPLAYAAVRIRRRMNRA